MSQIVHLSGEFDDATGQHCVRCGLLLAQPLHNLAWEEGTLPPRGWTPGVEIAVDGNWWTNLDCVEDPDAYNDMPRCEAA